MFELLIKHKHANKQVKKRFLKRNYRKKIDVSK